MAKAGWLNAKQLLESAAVVALIAHTKGMLARKENDMPAHFYSPDACKWCALGLIQATGANIGAVMQARRAVERVVGPKYASLQNWNDAPQRTPMDVYVVFMQAAEAL